MRVTHKPTIYIYHNLPNGGALETVNQLVEYLKKHDKKFEVITGTQIKPKNFINYMYIAIVKNFIHDLNLSRRINKDDSLIVFQSWLIKTPYIGILCKTKNKIYICHEPPREYYDNEYISQKNLKEKIVDFLRLPIKYIDMLNAKNTTAIYVANSKKSAEVIGRVYKKQPVVVYPGITITKRVTRNSRHNSQSNVVSVGSAVRAKRFDFIIRVISKIPLVIRPVYRIVGCNHNVKYLAYLKKLATKLQVKLVVRDCIKKSELAKEYANADIFCFAPINEPFGIAVIEAIYMGTPIIVYPDGSGFGEVINHRNGALIHNLDVNIWANKICDYLNNPAKLQEISAYNRKIGDKFKSHNFGAQIISLLQ